MFPTSRGGEIDDYKPYFKIYLSLSRPPLYPPNIIQPFIEETRIGFHSLPLLCAFTALYA
jgi:hypothetical protein